MTKYAFLHRSSPALSFTRCAVVLLFVLCLNLYSMWDIQAQTRTQRSTATHQIYTENHLISLVPVPLFFHGFRVDYDARLKDQLWLNVAPQLNYQRKPSDTMSLTGFCLELNLRFFEPRLKGLYFAAGLGFEYNESSKNNSNGNFYSVNTTRMGAQIQLGYMVKMWPRTMFDVYIGAAFRYAINKYPQASYEQLFKVDRVRPWSYQFSGVFMEAGIRIGFML